MSLESPIPERRDGTAGGAFICECWSPNFCAAHGCRKAQPDRQSRCSTDVPAALSRASILDAAREAVMVDRAATHGDLEDSFGLIAALWSAYLGRDLRPVDAALMLGLLKIARAKGNPGHADNFVDLAGYAACAGEVAGG